MRKNVFGKGIVLGMIILFIGAGITPIVGSIASEKNHMQWNVISSSGINYGGIIYVNNANTNNAPDGSYENPFRNITSAINKAYEDDDPDTVFVFRGSGTYNESIILTKPVHLIGEYVIGKYTHNPIIQTDEKATYGIRIETSHSKVEGFHIKGNKKDCSGILIDYKAWRNSVAYNIIENCKFGVELGDRTVWNDISYNLIQNCRLGGVFTDAFHWSGGNTIVNNLIRNIDDEAAIHISKSSSNYIGGNFIKDCVKGVEVYTSLTTSCFNIIASNVFDNCSSYDIWFYDAGFFNVVFANDFLGKYDTKKAYFEQTAITFWNSNYWGESVIKYTINGHFLMLPMKQYDVKPQKNPTVTDYDEFEWPPL